MNKEKATIYDLWRMCRYYGTVCSTCPLCDKDCGLGAGAPIEEMDEMNEIILNWCKEHPVKTRQDKFLEHYPHARAKKIGVLDICPKAIDIRVQCKSETGENGLSCPDCQKSYWLAEVKVNEM